MTKLLYPICEALSLNAFQIAQNFQKLLLWDGYETEWNCKDWLKTKEWSAQEDFGGTWASQVAIDYLQNILPSA